MTGLLADTSIWIAHHREADPVLVRAISRDSLWMHEFVIAELALGSLPDRTAFLADIGSLRRVSTMSAASVVAFAEQQNLVSTGLGFVDASLLKSLSETEGVRLWTLDKRLAKQAERIDLLYVP